MKSSGVENRNWFFGSQAGTEAIFILRADFSYNGVIGLPKGSLSAVLPKSIQWATGDRRASDSMCLEPAQSLQWPAQEFFGAQYRRLRAILGVPKFPGV